MKFFVIIALWFQDKLNVEQLQEEHPQHQHQEQQVSLLVQLVGVEEDSLAWSGDVRASCVCSDGLAG